MSRRHRSTPPLPARRQICRGGACLLLLLTILMALTATASADAWAFGLRAAWAPAQSGESAARAVARNDFRAFDPTRLSVIPRGAHGAWVTLRPGAGGWPAGGDLRLVLGSPALAPATLFVPGEPPRRASLFQAPHDQPRALDRLVFRWPARLPPDAPVLLRLDAYDGLSPPMTFSVEPAQALRHADTLRTVLVTSAFAAMLVTALIALVFALILRDVTFLYYAVYVGGYVLLQAVQSGYLAYPLGLSLSADGPALIGRVATGVSGAAAMFFLEHFARLRVLAPRWRRLVRFGAIGILLMGLAAASRIEVLVGLVRVLINPWLILCALAMLAAAIAAAWRGSRYALYFLVGWSPLLVVTALGSAQAGGALASWTQLDLWSIGVGAFEAVLLSLGLADRALALRHDRDEALQQAQTDELTQLLNRRAWLAQLRQMMDAARRHRRTLAVLFLDLDHFKRLNDALGHQAGDRALVALAEEMRDVLRPGDVIGRYGGEEFTVALLDCSREYAAQVAERLRARLEQARLVDDADAPPVSASIGVALMQRDDTLDSLLQRADQAMYGAKSGGRNQVRFAT